MTYSCSDKELFNKYTFPEQSTLGKFFGQTNKNQEVTECQRKSMDDIICSMQGGVHNIYNLGTCGTNRELNETGLADFIGDALSGQDKTKYEKMIQDCTTNGKKEHSIVDLLDCFNIDMMGKRLLQVNGCVIGKLPQLTISLENETKKHAFLIRERNTLRAEIEKIKAKELVKSQI